MPYRLEIAIKEGMRDTLGEENRRTIKESLGIAIELSRFVEVYNIDAELTGQEIELLASDVFVDNVIQHCEYKKPMHEQAWRIEIGYLPGVTDNVGNSAKQTIKDALGKEIDVYYSRIIALSGNLNEKICEEIAALFYNPLIEKAIIHSPLSAPQPYLPKVVIKQEPVVERISLHMNDARLLAFAKEKLLALSMDEFREIKAYLRDEYVFEQRKAVGLDNKITDVELEAIAQTWSEHCKHKIFNAMINYVENGERHSINSVFKTFIRGATELVKKPYIVSVFRDNGGIIKFNHNYDVAVKVETHNAPSALDPYGGALTGILGVQRDVLGTGLGALPIANLDVLCFGYLDEKNVPKGLLHPRRIYEGVVHGIQDGGNKMGIPTVNGSITFEKNFIARPLVYCGTIGIMPSQIGDVKTSEKTIKPGYFAVMAGGRIGKDGIHGATFSSLQLDENVPQSVVQIGDPITQKKMLDFVIEARDKRLYDAITDNGAGGLSSSIGELALLSGGCDIYLQNCPLKYSGLQPWEILVSESQERMTLAVSPEKYAELEKLAAKHDVEITIVGKFTDSGKFHVHHNAQTVAYLDMKFLHFGMPQMRLNAEWKKKVFPEPEITETDLGKILKALLAMPNIASKESVIRRYDHEVKGLSAIKPLMPGPTPTDAAVLKPFYGSDEGLVIAHGICPKYVQDSYNMAALAFDEAVRNAISVGAKFGYLACLDNFSWPDPISSEKNIDGSYKLAQLVRSCLSLYDYTTAYGVPMVSGKDSMKNDYTSGQERYSILPTLLVTVIGKIESVKHAVSSGFRNPGDYIYALGTTREELGGSEYYKLFNGIGNKIPEVRSSENLPLYRALSQAIEEGLVSTCHDLSDGGLAVSLAECTFPGLGADFDIAQLPKETDKEDAILFSESAGRFIVSVAPAKTAEFEKLMEGKAFAKAGRVRADKRYIIKRGDEILVNENIDDLKIAWNGFTGAVPKP